MTQRDRDRLVVLKKAQKRLISQKQAGAERQLTERQVRRLLKRLQAQGDKAVITRAAGGRPSNRRLSAEVREKAMAILSLPEWQDFGPTLASYHLAKDHDVIGREALRQMMIEAGLWRAKPQKVEDLLVWRPRRSCRGELVQWDTSEYDWLEGRGEKLYLIAMIDDATQMSRST